MSLDLHHNSCSKDAFTLKKTELNNMLFKIVG